MAPHGYGENLDLFAPTRKRSQAGSAGPAILAATGRIWLLMALAPRFSQLCH